MTTIYLHTHAADRIRNLQNPERLLDFIARLESNPTETCGEYSHTDPRGRVIEYKILGRYCMLFFKDPFADLVKILDIRNLEAL